MDSSPTSFAQCPVAGLAPGLGAQQGGGGDADGVPVDEEVMCTEVEEDIASDVGAAALHDGRRL